MSDWGYRDDESWNNPYPSGGESLREADRRIGAMNEADREGERMRQGKVGRIIKEARARAKERGDFFGAQAAAAEAAHRLNPILNGLGQEAVAGLFAKVEIRERADGEVVEVYKIIGF
jgi:hypothetical protein